MKVDGLAAGCIVSPFHNPRARYTVTAVRDEDFDAYSVRLWRGKRSTHWHTFKNDASLWRVVIRG